MHAPIVLRILVSLFLITVFGGGGLWAIVEGGIREQCTEAWLFGLAAILLGASVIAAIWT